MLPHYYEKYKTGQFDALTESLIADIKESGSDKMEGKLLLDFAKANNVSIMLYDNDGNVLLSYSYESALTVQEDTAFMGDTDSTELSIEQADGENSENSNELELSYNYSLQGKSRNLTISVPMQPLSEAKIVIVHIFPIAAIICILFSLFWRLFFHGSLPARYR